MFALIIGSCKIVPPSAAAALMIINWLYGIVPMSWTSYQAGVANQYLAAGKSPKQALSAVKHLEYCFGTWKMPK